MSNQQTSQIEASHSTKCHFLVRLEIITDYFRELIQLYNAMISTSLFQSKPYFNSSTGPRHTKHIK